MILVTFAVPFESAAFRRRGVSRSVRIIHTGVGVDAARVAMEHAVCESVPELVIASGFAGALAPDLAIGEVVCEAETAGRWRHAQFATSAEVLVNAAAKQEFRQQTGADVVEMETSAIREVCKLANVPMTALRVISDRAEDDLGLPPDLLSALADRPIATFPRLAWMLIRYGARRRAFLRLVRDCRVAQLALADALEQEISFRLRD